MPLFLVIYIRQLFCVGIAGEVQERIQPAVPQVLASCGLRKTGGQPRYDVHACRCGKFAASRRLPHPQARSTCQHIAGRPPWQIRSATVEQSHRRQLDVSVAPRDRCVSITVPRIGTAKKGRSSRRLRRVPGMALASEDTTSGRNISGPT